MFLGQANMVGRLLQPLIPYSTHLLEKIWTIASSFIDEIHRFRVCSEKLKHMNDK